MLAESLVQSTAVPLTRILRNTVFQGNKMSVMQGIGVYRPFLSILILNENIFEEIV